MFSILGEKVIWLFGIQQTQDVKRFACKGNNLFSIYLYKSQVKFRLYITILAFAEF